MQNKFLAKNIFQNIFIAELESSPAIRRPGSKNLISVPTSKINHRLKLCLSPHFSCVSLLVDATPGSRPSPRIPPTFPFPLFPFSLFLFLLFFFPSPFFLPLFFSAHARTDLPPVPTRSTPPGCLPHICPSRPVTCTAAANRAAAPRRHDESKHH